MLRLTRRRYRVQVRLREDNVKYQNWSLNRWVVKSYKTEDVSNQLNAYVETINSKNIEILGRVNHENKDKYDFEKHF